MTATIDQLVAQAKLLNGAPVLFVAPHVTNFQHKPSTTSPVFLLTHRGDADHRGTWGLPSADEIEPDADAVRKELRRAQDTIESRQSDVRSAEHEVTAAISVILAEESAELLAEFEAAAATYRRLREQAMSVSLALQKPWGLDYRNRTNPSAEGERVVDGSIERAEIES